MPRTNYHFTAPQTIAFVVTADDETTAHLLARAELRARHQTDALANIDIAFADWYLDLLIEGEAPLTLTGTTPEED